MNQIKFTKMNGLGNDFIILDYSEYLKTNLSPDKLALKLCNRNFGIGADGLIIVNPNTDKADISWIFYNSDGSIAQMCGNGIRCFARYIYDNKIINKPIYELIKSSSKSLIMTFEITISVNVLSPLIIV